MSWLRSVHQDARRRLLLRLNCSVQRCKIGNARNVSESNCTSMNEPKPYQNRISRIHLLIISSPTAKSSQVINNSHEASLVWNPSTYSSHIRSKLIDTEALASSPLCSMIIIRSPRIMASQDKKREGSSSRNELGVWKEKKLYLRTFCLFCILSFICVTIPKSILNIIFMLVTSFQ